MALLTALAACTSSPVATAPAPTSGGTQPPAQPRLYVSLGDSYATGLSPNGTGESFADIVAKQEGLDLVNLACNGATSAELLTQPACGPEADGRTQLDATVETLRTGKVGLVT